MSEEKKATPSTIIPLLSYRKSKQKSFSVSKISDRKSLVRQSRAAINKYPCRHKNQDEITINFFWKVIECFEKNDI